jgi:HEAT repeat protein
MKARIIPALLLLGWIPLDVGASEIEVLVERLKKTAKAGIGITKEEQAVAAKLQALGSMTIPYLLPLLRDRNGDIRDLTSYTLRNMEGLTEKHLDLLIESCRRDGGWLPTAIAKIGTPQAVTFLVAELVRDRTPMTQFTGAIEILGEKAVPQLIQVYQEEKGWDDKLEMTMISVFTELGEKAVAAIDPLLEIANDEAARRSKRMHAINTIGSIGIAARRAVPSLQKLQQNGDEQIRVAAVAAIISIGSPEATPILLERLKGADGSLQKIGLIFEIVSLKPDGKAVGSTIAKFLTDIDGEVRTVAAIALGYAGYQEAADDLIHMLGEEEDWRIVFGAAGSLGRLKSKEAMPSLTLVSTDHWYPPVREAALKAIKAVRGGVIVDAQVRSDFHAEFFSYSRVGWEVESLEEDEANLIQFPMAAIAEPSSIVTLKANQKAEMGEQCGIEVNDGYLIGSDRGEWGGEIRFVDFKGHSRVIVRANTEAIYQTSQGVMAVTGLAHLGTNNGCVYKINKGADGRWTAIAWRTFPGAPKFSRALKDGRILISCHGGIVLVSPDGDMRYLTRSESLLPMAPSR